MQLDMNIFLYEHRVFFCWGVTAALLTVLVFVVASPYLDRHADYNIEIERDSQLVQRLTRIVGSKETISASYEGFDSEGLINLVYSPSMTANQIP